jgi:hypothetical protein
MEAGATVPRAYMLSREATAGLVETALAAFTITPLSCVLISDMKDFPLAHEFHELVVRTPSEMDSVDFALTSFDETHMPALVIGTRPGMTAVYTDGHVENLLWQAADSIPN